MTTPGNLVQLVIDGQTVEGSYYTDGSFVSQDGTILVTPTGQVEHGITDPDTGVFLVNGEVRTIDGNKVYGSVQDGTFFSEDRTILVTPDGQVQHGITDPTTGVFLVNGEVRTIDGNKVYGSVQDGTFFSEDASRSGATSLPTFSHDSPLSI